LIEFLSYVMTVEVLVILVLVALIIYEERKRK
jgi:hypothetical protein